MTEKNKGVKALISIIIPVFNIEQYITNCLRCVIGQTYRNLEIILLDDGSCDGTGKICDSFAQKDSRIRVVHKSNTGQADTRNIGIEMANGEYIAFVDGDDCITEDYIEFLYGLLTEYDAKIAHCRMEKYWSHQELVRLKSRQNSVKAEVRVFDSQQAIENLCYMKNLNCAPVCKLFHRSIFQNIRFPVGCIYEDLGCIYLTFHEAGRVVFADETKYFYLQRHGSSMHSTFHEGKLSRVRFSEEILAFVRKYYPDICSAGQCRLFWSAAGAVMDLPFRQLFLPKYRYILENVKKTRASVLKDKQAKISVRIMAAGACTGMFMFKVLGNLYHIVMK